VFTSAEVLSFEDDQVVAFRRRCPCLLTVDCRQLNEEVCGLVVGVLMFGAFRMKLLSNIEHRVQRVYKLLYKLWSREDNYLVKMQSTLPVPCHSKS
jgi:hypothetical protein